MSDPCMTSGGKKIYLDEIQLFRDTMALSEQEKENILAAIMKETGRVCFRTATALC